MKKQNEDILVASLLAATLLALLATKLMLPFSSLFTILVLDAMAAYFIISSFIIRKDKDSQSAYYLHVNFDHVIFAVCSLTLLILIKHWRGADMMAKLSFFLLLFYSFTLVRKFKRNKEAGIKYKATYFITGYLPFWFFLVFMSTALVTTPRQFYNLFHGNTYEQFVRLKYPEEEAIKYINLSKPIDKESLEMAKKYYSLAIEKESEGEYDDALKLLNKSIDLDPDEAEAYYHRGWIRLTKLDISVEAARKALMDFNIALRFKPDMEAAQTGQAMAKKYIRDNSKAAE